MTHPTPVPVELSLVPITYHLPCYLARSRLCLAVHRYQVSSCRMAAKHLGDPQASGGTTVLQVGVEGMMLC